MRSVVAYCELSVPSEAAGSTVETLVRLGHKATLFCALGSVSRARHSPFLPATTTA